MHTFRYRRVRPGLLRARRIVWHRILLDRMVSHRIVLYCIASYCVESHRIVLYRVVCTLRCIALRRELRCIALRCMALYLHCIASRRDVASHRIMWHRIAYDRIRRRRFPSDRIGIASAPHRHGIGMAFHHIGIAWHRMAPHGIASRPVFAVLCVEEARRQARVASWPRDSSNSLVEIDALLAKMPSLKWLCLDATLRPTSDSCNLLCQMLRRSEHKPSDLAFCSH